MASVKKAASDVDTVAKQLNQVLNKKSPLFHMMFGAPGRIKETKVKEEKKENKDGSETKKTTVESTTSPTASPTESPMEAPSTNE
jgi:hypothetical protein